MKTPTWIQTRDYPGDIELVPIERVISVRMKLSPPQAPGGIVWLHIRLNGETDFIRVDNDKILPVAEALGILEALGQKAPPPAGDAEDARRYRVLNSLLNKSKTVVLRIRGDVFNVESAAPMMAGETLSRAIDEAKNL